MGQYIYSILSQQTSTGSDRTDAAFFTQLHSFVRAAVDSQTVNDVKLANDAIQKAVSGLRGTLAPYLSTPLTSDKSEIEKGIKDNIQFVVQQTSQRLQSTSPDIVTYRVMESAEVPLNRQMVGVIRRLLKNGKTMLADAGISAGRSYGAAYITQLRSENPGVIPLLNSAVKSVVQTDPAGEYSVVNDLLATSESSISLPTNDNGHRIMISIDLDDRGVALVKERRAVLKNQFGIDNVSIAERTLFSGFAGPVHVYFTTDLTVHPLGSILLSIIGDDTDLENAITIHGSVLILDKLL